MLPGRLAQGEPSHAITFRAARADTFLESIGGLHIEQG
jgi:hypothetical protein